MAVSRFVGFGAKKSKRCSLFGWSYNRIGIIASNTSNVRLWSLLDLKVTAPMWRDWVFVRARSELSILPNPREFGRDPWAPGLAGKTSQGSFL